MIKKVRENIKYVSYNNCNGSLQNRRRGMKRKIIKKLTILLTVIGMLLCNISYIYAEECSLVNEASETETDEEYAEDTVYSVLRGNNLNYGTTQIGKVSGHEINVYGLTQCHHKCARVYLNLSLERKVNGTYETYKTWKFTSNNATNLTKSINVIVPRGYYYRVRGYHAAKDGSKESVSTLTKGILIK